MGRSYSDDDLSRWSVKSHALGPGSKPAGADQSRYQSRATQAKAYGAG
jgi:hypothetical protein